MAEPKLEAPEAPTFYFIGVTTRSSSSRAIFPRWMEALNRPEVQWRGIDLEIGAPAETYRRVVAHIQENPLALGGLVTTHKIDLLAAAADYFDVLDPYALMAREVSSIAKEGGKLVGRATDPVAGGICLDAMLGPDYFSRTGAQVLMLGGGGAATALCLHFLQKKRAGDRPERILLVEKSPERLDTLRRKMAGFKTGIEFEMVVNEEPRVNDSFLAGLPAFSLVVNATGMGKDLPGSPISPAACFPENALAWELNYRGALDFLRLAERQHPTRSVRVADGWDYFLHSWTLIISQVVQVEVGPAMFRTLSGIAAGLR